MPLFHGLQYFLVGLIAFGRLEPAADQQIGNPAKRRNYNDCSIPFSGMLDDCQDKSDIFRVRH
jgi:hypothetical protein